MWKKFDRAEGKEMTASFPNTLLSNSFKGHAKVYLLNFKTIKREIRKISDDTK